MMLRSTASGGPRALAITAGLIVALLAAAVAGSSCTVPPSNPNPGPNDGLATAPTVTPTTLGSGASLYAGVRYATTSSWQHLDLYVPAGEGPFPVVVWLHGGFWTQGSRSQLDDGFRDALLAAGYAVATVDYRLAALFGVNRWPAGLLDAKLSVKYLQTHAVQLRLDPSRFTTSGHSAGGHLAVMAAISRDDPGVALSSGDPTVVGAVAFGAPIDIAMEMDDGVANFAISNVLGCSGSCDTSPMEPRRYLDADDPAVKLVISDDDQLVPTETVDTFVTAAADVGYGRLSIELLHGLDHDELYRDAPVSTYLPWLGALA